MRIFPKTIIVNSSTNSIQIGWVASEIKHVLTLTQTLIMRSVYLLAAYVTHDRCMYYVTCCLPKCLTEGRNAQLDIISTLINDTHSKSLNLKALWR
jgi:hypothetical protein